MGNCYTFPCVITRDDDGIYYAKFPDIPCCFTDGETLKEVLSNAEDVLSLVLYVLEKNGGTIPEAGKVSVETKENQSVYSISVNTQEV